MSYDEPTPVNGNIKGQWRAIALVGLGVEDVVSETLLHGIDFLEGRLPFCTCNSWEISDSYVDAHESLHEGSFDVKEQSCPK